MGTASRSRKCDVPRFGESIVRGLVIESGLAWEKLRCHTHIYRALFVGFFGQRVDAAARAPQFPGDPSEVDQFEDVLMAVGLADNSFRTQGSASTNSSRAANTR